MAKSSDQSKMRSEVKAQYSTKGTEPPNSIQLEIGGKANLVVSVKQCDGKLSMHWTLQGSEQVELRFAEVIKDLSASVLKIPKSEIGIEFGVVAELSTSFACWQCKLVFPGHLKEQIESPEFQSLLERFAGELSGANAVGCENIANQPPLHLEVKHAASQARQILHRSTIPKDLTVKSAFWKAPIQLPFKISAPARPTKTSVTKVAEGAFRGFHIEGRVAYFLVDCKSNRKPLDINFDEEKFLKEIHEKSSREFNTCRIKFIEICEADKVVGRQLVEIEVTKADLLPE